MLGAVAVTPTQLEAGVARNVTPPMCRAMLDIRTTPAYEHDEVVAMIRDHVDARVEIYSDRVRARPDAARFETAGGGDGGPTRSFPLRLTNLLRLGLSPPPRHGRADQGNSQQSHTADEWIELDDVKAAVQLYAAVAWEYLK